MLSFSVRQIVPVAFILLSSGVAAQGISSPMLAPQNFTTKGTHLVANAGLSFGGDTITIMNYNTIADQKIRAGDGFEIGVGMIYGAKEAPFATQFALNYHFNALTVGDGGTRFRHYPIEAMVFYTGVEQWRFGIGGRAVQSPRYTSKINSRETQILNFENSSGVMAEVGYAISPRIWVNVRYVFEKYRATKYWLGPSSVEMGSSPTKPLNGDHLLLGMNYLF